jgi:metal-responsive CopG/Arc/MetJ family transcriptional regulator
MATDMKRLSISIQDEFVPRLDRLKQKYFYNDTLSEMIRQILSAGIGAFEGKEQHDNSPADAPPEPAANE